jgi:hypothetical protein
VFGQFGDTGVEVVDEIEEHAAQVGVVLFELSGQGLGQGGFLGPHPGFGHLGDSAAQFAAGVGRVRDDRS